MRCVVALEGNASAATITYVMLYTRQQWQQGWVLKRKEDFCSQVTIDDLQTFWSTTGLVGGMLPWM